MRTLASIPSGISDDMHNSAPASGAPLDAGAVIVVLLAFTVVAWLGKSARVKSLPKL